MRMRIGNTEVKNWAAIVIDRSKISIRMQDAELRSAIRPGHCDSSCATDRRSRGGSRLSAAWTAASGVPGSGGPIRCGRSASVGDVVMGRLLAIVLLPESRAGESPPHHPGGVKDVPPHPLRAMQIAADAGRLVPRAWSRPLGVPALTEPSPR